VPQKPKLKIRDRIIIVLAKKYCLSLDELEKYTGINRKKLLVYLSRLAKEGLVTRTWGSYRDSYRDKKYRKYCLKTVIKEELGIG